MDGVMIGNLALIAYLAPLSLFVVALVASLNLVRSVDLTFQLGRAVSAGSFLLLLAIGIVVFTSGPIVSPLIRRRRSGHCAAPGCAECHDVVAGDIAGNIADPVQPQLS